LFNVEVRPQQLKEIYKEIKVFLQSELYKVFRATGKLRFHFCPLYNLELVELYRIYGEAVDYWCHIHKFLAALPRQTKDKVGPLVQAPCCSSLHCPYSSCKIVSAVNPLKGLVIARFNTVFHYDNFLFCEFLQIIKLFIINAIGPCANDYPLYFGVFKSLGVKPFKVFKRSVCI
jgi:hypothetical protein